MTEKHETAVSGRAQLSEITAVFLKNQKFLKRFLKRFFSDAQDIDDVAQETYLRAYVAEQKKKIEQPKAYLFQIARNVALTKLTKKSKRITDYLEESVQSVVTEHAAAADSEVEAQESLGIYCEAVAELPEKCRQVFLLRKVHGLTHKEIAEYMSLSVSSVEKYLLRGILQSKAFVDGYEKRVTESWPNAKSENGRVENRRQK